MQPVSCMAGNLGAWVNYTLAVGRYYGLSPELTSTCRSFQLQAELYRAYRSGASRYPANPPGESAHNYGLAWDSTVPPDQQAAWDQLRESIGWEVPPNDQIHAQVPGWRQYL